MKVVFEFDERAWESRPLRYAVRVVGTLLPWSSRLAPAPAETAPDDFVVAVGEPARARSGAAVVLAAGPWEPWTPGAVRVAAFQGATLLATDEASLATGSDREFPRAWLRSIAFALTREEELSEPRRDEWENFAGFYSRAHELGVLDEPLVDQLARQLADRLRRAGAGDDEAPRWKNGAPFAVALSHDVDWVRLHSGADAMRLLARSRGVRSYAFRAGLAQLAGSLRPRGGPDPYWNFERWTGEESARGFRSSFYFTPPDPRTPHEYDGTYRPEDRLTYGGRATTVSGLMHRLAEEGFEIGLHGSYHSHRDGDELARQKAQIERAAGCAVTGVRQHFLRFDARRTWAAQARAGFRYDTTLGYNEAIGFRSGVAAPHRAWDPDRGEALELLSVPLTVMDGALFRTLKLDADLAFRRVSGHLDRVQAVGGLAGLLWHPNAADPVRFPGWWSCYVRVLDDLQRRGAWVTSAGEIAGAWRERERRCVEDSRAH